jgi:hypothetical protein
MFELRKLVDGDEVIILPYPEKGIYKTLEYEVFIIPEIYNNSTQHTSNLFFFDSFSKQYEFYIDIKIILRRFTFKSLSTVKTSFAVCNNKLCVIRWERELYDIWSKETRKFSPDSRIYDNYSTNKLFVKQNTSPDKSFSNSYVSPERFLLPYQSTEEYLNDPDIIRLKKEFKNYISDYYADKHLEEIYNYLHSLNNFQIEKSLKDFSIISKLRKLKLERILSE